MKISLFTVLCEYDGGTYISQHLGENEIDACRKWMVDFSERSPVPIFSPLISDAVLADFERGDFPVNIGGLKNAWCASTSADGKYVGIVIVKTSSGDS